MVTWTVSIGEPVWLSTDLSWNCGLSIELLVINECSSLNWGFIVLTVVAFAITGAEDTGLETFTVFLETSWFLACTSFRMLLIGGFTRYLSGQHALPHQALTNYGIVSLNLSGCFLSTTGCCVDLWPECTRCLLKCLLYGLLSQLFVLKVVLTRVTVAMARDAVEAWSKALTVQFEALWVPAVASFSKLGLCLGCLLPNHSCCIHWLNRTSRCLWLRSLLVLESTRLLDLLNVGRLVVTLLEGSSGNWVLIMNIVTELSIPLRRRITIWSRPVLRRQNLISTRNLMSWRRFPRCAIVHAYKRGCEQLVDH